MNYDKYKAFLFKESGVANDKIKMAGIKKTGSNDCIICFIPTDLSSFPLIGTIITRWHPDLSSPNSNYNIVGWNSSGNWFTFCYNCKTGVFSSDYGTRKDTNVVCFAKQNGYSMYFQTI